MTSLPLLTLTLSQDTIPVDSPWRLLYLLVQIRPGETDPGAEVLPVNIGFVVDKSDSMCIPMLTPRQFQELARFGAVSETMVDGLAVWHFANVPLSHTVDAPRSIDFVKRALFDALERLTPRDQFSLVVFANEARVLLPPGSGQRGGELARVIDQLESMSLGKETCLAAGLQLGYDLIRQCYSQEQINRLIVLTDGFTLDAPESRSMAQTAAQTGISTTTMGLGVEFNEELLISMADSTGGNAYFIRDPAEIARAFDRELAGAQNVIHRDLVLKMRFMRDVQVRRLHRVKPVISDLGSPSTTEERSLDLALGDLSRGGEIALLFELLVPVRPPGVYRLARSTVALKQPIQGTDGQALQQDCVVHYAEGPADDVPINPQVLNVAEKTSAFKLQTRALEDARRGNFVRATHDLRAAATRLKSIGENRLAQAALNEAANLEQRGQMSAAGTKQLRYATRRLV